MNKASLQLQPKLLLLALLLLGASAALVYSRWESYVHIFRHGIDAPQRITQGPNHAAILRQSGFDLSHLGIPKQEVLSGGPPKDGIPALTRPKMVASQDSDYLEDEDRVIGMATESFVRAYPLNILNYHEIVNDVAGELNFAVSYCPLCDSAFAFNRKIGSSVREFGVSGLLFNSNVLFFDRTSEQETLWSQLKGQGVSGEATGLELQSLPCEMTTWKDWKSRYPQTQVLSPETGHTRNYRRDSYQRYFSSPRLLFPVEPQSERLGAKEEVLGVIAGRYFSRLPHL